MGFWKSILFSLIFCGVGLVCLVPTAWADDISITCKKKNCALNSKYEALFDVKNAMPGEEYRRNVTVFNYQKTNTLFFLSPVAANIQSIDQSLAEVLSFEVINLDAQKSLLGPIKLSDFKNIKNPVLIGMIAADSAKNYQIIIKFGHDVGNQYQSKSTQFNLAFGFEEANTQASLVSVKSGVYPESQLSNLIGAFDSTLSGQVAGASTEWLQPGLVGSTEKTTRMIALLGGLIFALLASFVLWIGNRWWRQRHTVG